MDGELEVQLENQLKVLRLEVEKRKRMFAIVCSGLLGIMAVIVVCVWVKPRGISAAEMFGIFPFVSFVLFAAATIAAGWILEAAENRVNYVEWEIEDLHREPEY